MLTRRAKRARRLSKEDDEEEENAHFVTSEGNKVYFYADVTKKTALVLFSHLDKAAQCAFRSVSIDSPPTIYVYVHSNGGDAYVGLSLFDHLKAMPVRVVTIADGFVASSASLLLLGGHEKIGLPHSQILIHQLRTEFWGKYDELLDEVKNSRNIMKTVEKLYKDNTSLSDGALANLLKKELNLSAKQSLRYGLIDRISQPFA